MKRSRRGASIRELHRSKTAQVKALLHGHITLSRFGTVVESACDLVSHLRAGADSNTDDVEELLSAKWNLGRHMLALDMAIDNVMKARIHAQRVAGTFGGISIATDESPPSAPRFSGQRFQVTMVYIASFAPLRTWESRDEPPVTEVPHLADIVHCPGKKRQRRLPGPREATRPIGHLGV